MIVPVHVHVSAGGRAGSITPMGLQRFERRLERLVEGTFSKAFRSGRVALGDEPAVIGRMPECAVPLSDPQVSRRHAEVRRDEFGFRVVDLGSTNGTQVNGVVVKEHSLNDGDVIVVGATSLRYQES